MILKSVCSYVGKMMVEQTCALTFCETVQQVPGTPCLSPTPTAACVLLAQKERKKNKIIVLILSE